MISSGSGTVKAVLLNEASGGLERWGGLQLTMILNIGVILLFALFFCPGNDL